MDRIFLDMVKWGEYNNKVSIRMHKLRIDLEEVYIYVDDLSAKEKTKKERAWIQKKNEDF